MPNKINHLTTSFSLQNFTVGQIWDTTAKNRVNLPRMLGKMIRCQVSIPLNHFDAFPCAHFCAEATARRDATKRQLIVAYAPWWNTPADSQHAMPFQAGIIYVNLTIQDRYEVSCQVNFLNLFQSGADDDIHWKCFRNNYGTWLGSASGHSC